MTRDRRQAEDVVQEAFISRVAQLPALRSASRQRAGLAAGHRAPPGNRLPASRSERDRPWEPLEEHDRADPRAVDPSIEAGRRDEAAAVRRALTRLPAEQALVLTLAYFGDLSQSEIAERVAIPLGTVKGRTRAALRQLAGELASRVPVPALMPDAA